MNKKEVREILNTPRANFHYVIGLLTKYFLEDPIKSIMVNQIVAKAKDKKKFNTLDLFSFFYEYAKDIVTNTRFSKTDYSDKMLLKSVWENARIQNIAVSQIKQGYKMFPVTEEDLKEIKRIRRKEQLRKQAALMRKAKARKRAEKLAKEKAEKEKREGVKNPAQNVSNTKSKKFTEEQLKQIEMLKNMST